MTLDCLINLQLRSEIIRCITKQFIKKFPLSDSLFLNQNLKAHLHDFPHYVSDRNSTSVITNVKTS